MTKNNECKSCEHLKRVISETKYVIKDIQMANESLLMRINLLDAVIAKLGCKDEEDCEYGYPWNCDKCPASAMNKK